mgnify:CR=1 FL=1
MPFTRTTSNVRHTRPEPAASRVEAAASTLTPTVHVIGRVLGFVEELVVEDDPEYEWGDNFRKARTSNESRQLLLYKIMINTRKWLS